MSRGRAQSAGSATTSPSPGKLPWRALVGVGAIAAVGAGGFFGWQWYARPARIVAQLPATPASANATLAERVARARADAGNRGHGLAAVAELGRLLHANGFTAEAATCWELLRREQPGDARWYRFLADARRAQSDYGAMESLLEQAVKLDPGDASAWLQLAGLKFKTGRLDAAEHDYAQRLARLAGDPHAQLGLARCALQAGHAAEGRRRVDELVRTRPDFPPGFNLLAELLAAAGDQEGATLNRWLGREAGRFREAEDPLLDGLSEWCLDPERLRTLGTVQFQTRRGDRGKALFERAVALSPEAPGGHAALGELLLELREPKAALGELELAKALSPEGRLDSGAYANLARAYREVERRAEALATVREGLRVCGDQPNLLPMLGLALAENGRFAEAETAYRGAIARLPQDANVHYNFAALLLEGGRRAEGKSELRNALQAQPVFPKALQLLGELEMEDGNLDEAGRHWTRLQETNPGQPEARRQLARWHARVGTLSQEKGDAAMAEKHFRAACTLVPDAAELSANLGVLLLVQGRAQEAVGPLESYARGAARDAQAALFLGQAYARLGRFDEAKTQLRRGAQLGDETGRKPTAEFCREILRQLPP